MKVELTYVAINGRAVKAPQDQTHLDWLESEYTKSSTRAFAAEVQGHTALVERCSVTPTLWWAILESGDAHLIVKQHKYSDETLVADTGTGPIERPVRLLIPTELLRAGLEALAGVESDDVEWEDGAHWGVVRTPGDE